MKASAAGKVVLVTGAQRGLGLEACRKLGRLGYAIVLTSKVVGAGRKATLSLEKEGFQVQFLPLDVTDDDAVRAARKFVRARFGRLDALVNNAGIMPDGGESVLKVTASMFQHVLNVNTLGALRMSQAFMPMMLRQNYGRIVNVASGKGQLTQESIYSMVDDAPAYNMSKAALNALTLMLADTATGTNVLVNSVCPGWCRTDLGGPDAPRSAKKGAETIVWLATLPDGGPTAGFFRDKKPIPW